MILITTIIFMLKGMLTRQFPEQINVIQRVYHHHHSTFQQVTVFIYFIFDTERCNNVPE